MTPSEHERPTDLHRLEDAQAQRHPEGNVPESTDQPRQGVVVSDTPPAEEQLNPLPDLT